MFSTFALAFSCVSKSCFQVTSTSPKFACNFKPDERIHDENLLIPLHDRKPYFLAFGSSAAGSAALRFSQGDDGTGSSLSVVSMAFSEVQDVAGAS